MEIKHTNNEKEGSFNAYDNGMHAGEMTYTWANPQTFIIEHTIGNPQFKGVGLKLLDGAVSYARENGLKIIPQCPFAKKMFERKPELHDVLASA